MHFQQPTLLASSLLALLSLSLGLLLRVSRA